MSDRISRWLDLLWPSDCVACGGAGHGHALCGACRTLLVAPIHRPCARCHVPLSTTAVECARCAHTPPAFDAVATLGIYRGDLDRAPLVRAVRALKYGGRRAVARDLGALLALHYPFDARAVVTPVPLHKDRLRSRGYNQAALLARALARGRGLACDLRLLARRRPTSTQASLGRADERRRNLAAAIIVRRPALVRDRAIVVVDDVVTTGATADACARALRAAGARSVAVFAVGRTP